MAQNQNIGLLGQYLTVNTTANSIAFSTTISANGYIGSAGQVLSSNSVGGLYWSTSSGGSSGGVTTGKAIAMAMIFGF